ncbi:hypothetical protein [Pseudogemmobacter sonorensis]|uniref:hypothetical protein n=1 Tax=Pseudogemmobacter sonorensis TaxID=2989681 RepID=UPI0036A18C44
MAREASKARVAPDFFAAHLVSKLRGWSDCDLEYRGRLTHPMRYDPGTDCNEPVAWDEAFAGIGAALRGFQPDPVEFYPSGRASNEAAFLYQTLVGL